MESERSETRKESFQFAPTAENVDNIAFCHHKRSSWLVIMHFLFFSPKLILHLQSPRVNQPKGPVFSSPHTHIRLGFKDGGANDVSLKFSSVLNFLLECVLLESFQETKRNVCVIVLSCIVMMKAEKSI